MTTKISTDNIQASTLEALSGGGGVTPPTAQLGYFNPE
jgi:hypothetical protein